MLLQIAANNHHDKIAAHPSQNTNSTIVHRIPNIGNSLCANFRQVPKSPDRQDHSSSSHTVLTMLLCFVMVSVTFFSPLVLLQHTNINKYKQTQNEKKKIDKIIDLSCDLDQVKTWHLIALSTICTPNIRGLRWHSLKAIDLQKCGFHSNDDSWRVSMSFLLTQSNTFGMRIHICLLTTNTAMEKHKGRNKRRKEIFKIHFMREINSKRKKKPKHSKWNLNVFSANNQPRLCIETKWMHKQSAEMCAKSMESKWQNKR